MEAVMTESYQLYHGDCLDVMKDIKKLILNTLGGVSCTSNPYD